MGVGDQCNVIVTLTQLSAFVGLNCHNCIVMHGMEDVQFFVTLSCFGTTVTFSGISCTKF